jgi:uncharacterized membrane protein HdeD (DUF308 family)
VLVLVIGAWAVAGGIVEVVNGFRGAQTEGTRALYILTGLVAVAFGILLFARPGVGAITLALLFGLFALIYGVSRITLGIHLRDLHKHRPAKPPSTVHTTA